MYLDYLYAVFYYIVRSDTQKYPQVKISALQEQHLFIIYIFQFIKYPLSQSRQFPYSGTSVPTFPKLRFPKVRIFTVKNG